jgi:hypothetical protein
MELSMTIALAAALAIREIFTALVITLLVLVAEILEGLTVSRGRQEGVTEECKQFVKRFLKIGPEDTNAPKVRTRCPTLEKQGIHHSGRKIKNGSYRASSEQ